MVERHTFLLPFEGYTEALALALKLGHLRIDVHELAEVVAGLGTQRADPQVGQVQLVTGLQPARGQTASRHQSCPWDRDGREAAMRGAVLSAQGARRRGNDAGQPRCWMVPGGAIAHCLPLRRR